MSSTIVQNIADHFHQVCFGGNWTCSNLKDVLSKVSWADAVKKTEGFNSIAALTYHISYFFTPVIDVLEGRALNSHDKFSYDHPPINGEDDWKNLVSKLFSDAEKLTELINKFPDEKLNEIFVQEKYGTYYRNLHGLIEHTHYHLGQMVILKKVLSV